MVQYIKATNYNDFDREMNDFKMRSIAGMYNSHYIDFEANNQGFAIEFADGCLDGEFRVISYKNKDCMFFDNTKEMWDYLTK